MADIPPNVPSVPGGAVPPKKETGKVQPKKETVRITLPPKPSAAPTIKLPTLPPGGPTGAPSAASLPSAARPAPAAAAAQRGTSAPVAPRPPAPRPAPSMGPTIGGLDQVLAFGAAIAGLVAVGSVLYLMFGIPTGY